MSSAQRPSHVISTPKRMATPRSAQAQMGQAFVGIGRHEIYEVRIYNHAAGEAAATLAIDGLSAFAFSEIRDRMQLIVEISTSHSDFFVRNLLMMRCERRLALLVKRGTAFIYGSFSTSPAS